MEAKYFIMPFGKFKGNTLDAVAESDAGLLYLDWAAGELDGEAGKAVREYMTDPAIATEVNRLVEDNEDRREK